MRKKSILGALAGVLVLGVAGYAIASPQFTQTAELKFNTKKTSKSAGITAKLTAADPGAVPPGNIKSATRVVIQLAPGTKTDTSVAPRCTDAQLNSFSCPANSQIGTGSAVANAVAANGTVLIANVQNTIKAYNMKGAIGFLIQGTSLPITLPLKSVLSKKGKLTTDLTKVPPPLGAGSKTVLTSFQVTVNPKSKGRGKRRKNLITTPKGCPKGGWKFTSNFTYDDASTARVVAKQACKKPRR